MKRSKIITLLLMAGTAIGAAIPLGAAAQQVSPWYVSGSLGQSRYSSGFDDNKDTAFNFSGGYWLSPNVGVEVGYTDFGKAKAGNDEFKKRTAYGAVVLNAPVTELFSVYGKAGYGSTKYSVYRPDVVTVLPDVIVTSVGINYSGKQSEAIYGLGAGYTFTRNITGTVEWQRLDKSKIDVGMVGVRFAF